jgi:hypothetical protein
VERCSECGRRILGNASDEMPDSEASGELGTIAHSAELVALDGEMLPDPVRSWTGRFAVYRSQKMVLRDIVLMETKRSRFADWCPTIVVATVGKLGGSAFAARMTGFSWTDSFALGALMNTRGLMELVVLNIGYDLGILSPRIFAMMVIMALATTLMTGPLLSLIGQASARRPHYADQPPGSRG